PGLINAGVYLLNTAKFLSETPSDKPFSIEHDYFQKEAAKGSLFGQPFSSYFIDIGLPDDYQKAQHDFERFIY
ncbi:MAG: histidinol phosphate phosphatase, partial [Sphingobacteriia bacterium]|nr:histidinol phosphate phosphatase [Sphingobacteriia bacterium]